MTIRRRVGLFQGLVEQDGGKDVDDICQKVCELYSTVDSMLAERADDLL